ncbi:hypothetical protein ACFL56_03840, partial [Candidatus Margulisiibacteriota bacterium]
SFPYYYGFAGGIGIDIGPVFMVGLEIESYTAPEYKVKDGDNEADVVMTNGRTGLFGQLVNPVFPLRFTIGTQSLILELAGVSGPVAVLGIDDMVKDKTFSATYYKLALDYKMAWFNVRPGISTFILEFNNDYYSIPSFDVVFGVAI